MSWDPFKPLWSKENKDSVFDPVDWNTPSSGASSNSNWAYSSSFSSSSEQSNANTSWAFSTSSSSNNNGDGKNSSWAYQTSSSLGRGFGFGDSQGFGNDANLFHLESQQRESVWGKCDGSSWHWSNTSRDLELGGAIDSARRTNEQNSLFSQSIGYSSSRSHFAASSDTPSSFNPFCANWSLKKIG